jgi:hypothetical protein
MFTELLNVQDCLRICFIMNIRSFNLITLHEGQDSPQVHCADVCCPSTAQSNATLFEVGDCLLLPSENQFNPLPCR